MGKRSKQVSRFVGDILYWVGVSWMHGHIFSVVPEICRAIRLVLFRMARARVVGLERRAVVVHFLVSSANSQS
uniref:Uncharacterized protein n=1 Tax=Meloidogyne incognita TaxID=6306 RepID=A0A914LFB5_MELIC